MTDKKYFKRIEGFKKLPKKSLFANNSDSDKKIAKKKSLFSKISSNKLINDQKGNYSIIISAILLLSFLLLSIVVLNTALEEQDRNADAISSNQFQYIIEDYKRNLPLIEREALEELSEDVIKNRKACIDSRADLKELIDAKLAEKNREYHENYNILIESSIVGIENTSDPFSCKFKTYISSEKGISHMKR